jgi:hypothetical protein
LLNSLLCVVGRPLVKYESEEEEEEEEMVSRVKEEKRDGERRTEYRCATCRKPPVPPDIRWAG